MTLSKFIEKLKEIEAQGHGELPVLLADWNEEYAKPNEEVAEKISVNAEAVVIGW